MDRVTIKLLLLLSVATLALVTTSCYPPKAVIDPESKTPGYKIFSGSSKGFRISFEYPDSWKRTAVEHGGGSGRSYLPLFLPDSYITISSDSDNQPADAAIQLRLDIISKYPEYKLISRSNNTLGQTTSEQVVSSYPFEGQDNLLPQAYANIGETVIERVITVNYKGYIYYIYFLANLVAYDNEKPGFEHMLSTFRFLN